MYLWFRITCLVALSISLPGARAAQAAWRSTLYPESWIPTDVDAQGRFLHDFSYAGYHQGELSIPTDPPGSTYIVTNTPYNADNTGGNDATAAIQQAINDAAAAGGGVVYLPAGTYNVAPGANSYALRINRSGVVLRGAGSNQTYICNTDPSMRAKSVILVQPSTGDWHAPLSGSEILAPSDIGYPSRTIPLSSVSGLSIGDTVILRADCTDDFIAEHLMTGLWNADLQGPAFCRKITSVNVASNTINVDIPTRYYLKARDSARIYKVAPLLEEVGLEGFSIGMKQNYKSDWKEEDYIVPGTGAYEVHSSHAIKFKHARNSWVQRVSTYRPPANAGDYHVLSNILLLDESIHVTVRQCLFQKPQYKGGGGNGYGYTLSGNDCLITDCTAVSCRHNYDLKSMKTSGNVIHRSQGRSARLASDFHMHLSMANLFDSMSLNGDFLQAVYRPYGTILHGHSTTESVFWNTYGTGSGTAVESRQWGWGYVIGTSGSRSSVTRGTANNTAPEDFLEGQGSGATLEPQSLYLDQLAKRLRGVLVNTSQELTRFGPDVAVPLHGTVYSYGDGGTVSQVWSQVSGPTAAIAAPHALSTTVACAKTGTYVFRLTVWEGGATNQSEVTVRVLVGSVAPLSSKDVIVGESQTSAPAAGYYPDATLSNSNLSGTQGSSYSNARENRVVVLGFKLPTLPIGSTFTNATLNFEIVKARDHAAIDPSLNVYLLDTENPDSTGTEFFYHGPGDSNNAVTFVGETYISVGTIAEEFAAGQYDQAYTLTGAARALLESFYGGDNTPDQSEAFFRFNLNKEWNYLSGSPYQQYWLNLADDESSLFIEHTVPPPKGSVVIIF
ncbi:MAG: glycosyl hydrolase family 28-related protein [Kiritimatiellae bacterium]|nr:glycosyl hydrolase family 28-related protein [Kiritimatiellia bacterium]